MSYCCNCGKEVNNGDVLCPECRAKLNSATNGCKNEQTDFTSTNNSRVANYAPWETPTNGLKEAILSFVFAVVSFVLLCTALAITNIVAEVAVHMLLVSIPLAIVSVVLGFKSKKHYKKYVKLGVNKDKRIYRFSIFGIVIGIVALVLIAIWMFLVIMAFGIAVLFLIWASMIPGGV